MTYERIVVFDAWGKAFDALITVVVFAGGLALSFMTVWTACAELLRSTATKLMQEKAPSVRKKEGGGKKALSLYWRLVLLNMQTDKKRVAVTVASIAGCCALLLAGFSMRSSIIDALNRQFEEVTLFEVRINYDKEVSEPEYTSSNSVIYSVSIVLPEEIESEVKSSTG